MGTEANRIVGRTEVPAAGRIGLAPQIGTTALESQEFWRREDVPRSTAERHLPHGATGMGGGEEGRRFGEPNRPCRMAPPMALGLLASRALSSTAANWSYPDGEIALTRVT